MYQRSESYPLMRTTHFLRPSSQCILAPIIPPRPGGLETPAANSRPDGRSDGSRTCAKDRAVAISVGVSAGQHAGALANSNNRMVSTIVARLRFIFPHPFALRLTHHSSRFTHQIGCNPGNSNPSISGKPYIRFMLCTALSSSALMMFLILQTAVVSPA